MTTQPRPDRVMAARLVCVTGDAEQSLRDAGFTLGKRPRQAIRRVFASPAFVEALRLECSRRLTQSASDVAAGLACEAQLAAAKDLAVQVEKMISLHSGGLQPSDPRPAL